MVLYTRTNLRIPPSRVKVEVSSLFISLLGIREINTHGAFKT